MFKLSVLLSSQIIALDPVLGSFLILTSVILMVLVIINLFVSAILMSFGKERKSLKVGNSMAWEFIYWFPPLPKSRAHSYENF